MGSDWCRHLPHRFGDHPLRAKNGLRPITGPAAETLDNATFVYALSFAGAQHLRQFLAKPGDVGDIAINLADLLLDEKIDILAGLIRLIGQREQLPHLCHAEAEIARSADEGERSQLDTRKNPSL
jgi:hypothetical protein